MVNVNENVNEEVNAPGTHCFSAASAASCCPGGEDVIAIIATIISPTLPPSSFWQNLLQIFMIFFPKTFKIFLIAKTFSASFQRKYGQKTKGDTAEGDNKAARDPRLQ